MELTVREQIFELYASLLPAKRSRLERLEAMNAPGLIVEKVKSDIAALEAGEIPFKVNGLDELGQLFVLIEPEKKLGRGGVPYFEMGVAGNVVRFFPNGKHGAFVKLAY